MKNVELQVVFVILTKCEGYLPVACVQLMVLLLSLPNALTVPVSGIPVPPSLACLLVCKSSAPFREGGIKRGICGVNFDREKNKGEKTVSYETFCH